MPQCDRIMAIKEQAAAAAAAVMVVVLIKTVMIIIPSITTYTSINYY
jgi:hypothetical protein